MKQRRGRVNELLFSVVALFVLTCLSLPIPQISASQSDETDAGIQASSDTTMLHLPVVMRADCPPSSGERIRPGSVTVGDLSVVGESDTYNFCGSAGDIIRVDMSRVSGAVNPEVDIYRPDGTELCEDSTTGSYISLECTLDTAGAHTVLAGDRHRDGMGEYSFYLQRLNSPGGATPLTFGEVFTASLVLQSERDSYTFSGATGDVVRLDMNRTGGSINSEVDVYRPDGTELCEDSTTGSYISLECTLDTAGTYTVLAGDRHQDGTGEYSFYLQRLNNPGGATPLTFGEVFTASLVLQSERDSYTFSGATGDVVRLDMNRTGGSINSEVDVYRPDGTELCEDSTTGSYISLECTLDTAGTYTVLAGDRHQDGTGEYSFYLQRLNIHSVHSVAGTEGEHGEHEDGRAVDE